MDALPGGAVARAERLQCHFSCTPKLILIGEAPGYQGAHFSGVAFTNELLIMRGAIPRVSSTFRLTVRHNPWSEPSATIVWGALKDLGLAEHTVLWNTFAWHPHRPGDLLSNRTPRPEEVQNGLPVLKAFLAMFRGVPLVPVGKVAERALANVGIDPLAAVRHPAMGGATEFRRGLAALRANGVI